MRVISITGGVGSGKSEVLSILRDEYDAEIIIADQVAHQLMIKGTDGHRQVLGLFGPTCLADDGEIDRKKLAELLFVDKTNVENVNKIIHPMVWRRIEERIVNSRKNLVMVEAALFDEEHNAMFDEIWYVYATVDNRISRLMNNRGYSKEKCMEIMKNQATESEFHALADYVIDNNGAVEQIRAQLNDRLVRPAGVERGKTNADG